MPAEFKQLLREFEHFGANYCVNARSVIQDPEQKKLVDIYEAGLCQALAGLRELLEKQYGNLAKKQQADLDQTAIFYGGLAMLKKANTIAGGETVASALALAEMGEIFEKIKNILRKILENISNRVAPLLDIIDEIVDNIIKLLGELPKAIGELQQIIKDIVEKQKKLLEELSNISKALHDIMQTIIEKIEA